MREAAYCISVGHFQQQCSQSRDQAAERCRLQVLKHREEAPTDEIEEASRQLRTFLEQYLQMGSRNRPNACRLNGLGRAMVHALADASHFSENGWWSEFCDDQLLVAVSAERLDAALFENEENLAAFAQPEEDVAGGRIADCGVRCDGLHHGSG